MKTTSRLLAALVLLLAPALAFSETMPLDLEAGWRFVSVLGNQDMYRTQINERQGFLVRSLTLTPNLADKDGMLDTVRLYANDIGAGPNGAIRLEMGKSKTFRLRASYMHSDLFDKVPAFANPFLEQGIIPSQHSMDRRRNMVDVDLEIFPNCAFTPILGYSWNRYEGPAQTTYFAGQDEFKISQDLRSTEQEMRIGAAFDFGPLTGQVIQGWRKLYELETDNLTPGASSGNGTGTVLGQTLSMNGLSRTSTTENNNTPVTTAALALRVSKDIKLSAQYVKAQSSTSTSESEGYNGNFVSFPLALFYGGFSDAISANAKNTNYRWNVRGEFSIAPNLDLSGGWTRRHNKLDGLALITSLYAGNTSYTGFKLSDVQTFLNAQTALERTEDVYDARLTARALGPVSLSAGWTGTDQDLTLTPDPSEIVVPGTNQGGSFQRSIYQIDGRATFNVKGFSFVAQIANAHANRAVVRTDFVDRLSYKLRASVTPVSMLTLGATFERLEDTNSPFFYTSRSSRFAGDVELRPTKPLTLRFSLGRFNAFSVIPIRNPYDFSTSSSQDDQNGLSYEGGLNLALGRVALDASYGSFDNNAGNYPYTLARARSRLEVGLVQNFALVGEFDWDRYHEFLPGTLPFGNYSAQRFGIYLHIKP